MELKRKQIKRMYKNIIKIGYCELSELLSYTKKMGYTAGVYGWNADIFELDWNTVIVTGYRPFGNINPDYTIIRKYNKEARKLKNETKSFRQLIIELNKLIENFKNEVIKEENMFSWVIFKYKDGSNPYIAKTEKEKNRILKKYKGKIEQIKTNVFFINNI